MSWHVWHRWGRWTRYVHPYMSSPGIIAPKALRGQWFQTADLRERRECSVCGKTQDRLVAADITELNP